jgi:fructose-1,6-bisphosphatase I
MSERATLEGHLDSWARDDAGKAAIAVTLKALAGACITIAHFLELGSLSGPLGAVTGRHGAFDPQRELDVFANNAIIGALAGTPVALLVSEELDDPLPMEPAAPLIVAVDPLDGASNADTNAAIGTIFSVLPNATHPAHLLVGSSQLASGFAIYGPQTVLALTVGAGTSIFTLDPRSGQFVTTATRAAIPEHAAEFAINASNHWHWDEPIRTYVDDCLRGKDGPRAAAYNMRWTGSFVAEIYRILMRGGVYLYPGDKRKGFTEGRMRLVYEANPIAFLVEQAGGCASTGRQRILDVPARTWHQRTPVIVGSCREVDYLQRLTCDPHAITERSPLFGRRGLFRI